ncbi:MAG: family 10 glycosylhydrolase [Planctomycetota bacterium]
MLAVSLVAATLFVQSERPLAREPEIRGVWIPNSHSTFFDSRENVRAQMQALADAGVNVVFPVVWSKGMTLFKSDVAEVVTGIAIDPRYGERDPLAEVLFEAHRHGIEVVPWFEYGFAAGHETFPGKALEARPEWAALDAAGQPVVKNGFQWMNSLDEEVQAFITGLVIECATDYDVDGVQGDDRLPALPVEAGYDAKTVERYRREHREPPPSDCRDPEWIQWRADLLTDYLASLREDVRDLSPDLAFSMAPGAPGWSLREYLQDQATWLERGLVDALHPQLYARDAEGYVRMADEMLAVEWLDKERDRIAPGALSSFREYLIDPETALGAVAANRERRLVGEVWFYERGLIENEGAVAVALAEGPYAKRARLPWRKSANWRPPALVGAPAPAGDEVAWRVRPPADGTYRIWVEEKPAEGEPEGTDPAAPGPGWTPLGTKRLSRGRTNDLIRVPKDASDDVLRVLAIIDRRAERR